MTSPKLNVVPLGLLTPLLGSAGLGHVSTGRMESKYLFYQKGATQQKDNTSLFLAVNRPLLKSLLTHNSFSQYKTVRPRKRQH